MSVRKNTPTSLLRIDVSIRCNFSFEARNIEVRDSDALLRVHDVYEGYLSPVILCVVPSGLRSIVGLVFRNIWS